MARSTAGEDLRALAGHGVLTSLGRGPSTRYVFTGSVAGSSSRAGRPVKWTDAVIERELRAFLGGKTEWPSPNEFREAGQGALYSAAARAGGIPRWRQLVGM